MGFDHTTFETFIYSLKYVSSFSKLLTLGKQYMYTVDERMKTIPKKYKLNISSENFKMDTDDLIKQLGFKSTDSIDYSSYEQATIIHDMNKPITISERFDLIFDGGCTEHIYNLPQVFDNIINLLEVGGIFVGITVNNNFSGHGFYQFSPEFFLSTFSNKYGMELLELSLIVNGADFESRINVKSYESGRNTTKINTTEQTYILIIARKIYNSTFNLNASPPQQNSYEKIDWVKN